MEIYIIVDSLSFSSLEFVIERDFRIYSYELIYCIRFVIVIKFNSDMQQIRR